MSAVLFQPHSDDCALFSAYNAIRFEAKVITCFRSVQQDVFGITQDERHAEDIAAMEALGLAGPEQWYFPDDGNDGDGIHELRAALSEAVAGCKIVITPAIEPTANRQHNLVCRLVDEISPSTTRIRYLTYSAGAVRSTNGREVAFSPEWVYRKLAALSCYRSQAKAPSYIHFVDPLIEYVA